MAKKTFSRVAVVMVALAIFVALVAPLSAFAETTPEIWDGAVAKGFASGTGSKNDPYIIKTGAQLAYLASSVNAGTNYEGKYFKLGNDIVLNDTSNWENWGAAAPKNQWTAIGSLSKSFQGNFDGDGHAVRGIYINTTTDSQGLFGNTKNAEIQNVGVTMSYIQGDSYVGGVVGHDYISTVKNCYNTGNVSGTDEEIGGVVGKSDGTVENCYNTGNVSGPRYWVGGVVGKNENGTIRNCYNTGSVSGSGVVGENQYGTIENCYNTGVVSSKNFVGGVVGSTYDGTVKNCYNIGNVIGTGSNVGGVVGDNDGTIENCYNTGNVTGTGSCIGGVVGMTDDHHTIKNCYNTGNVIGGMYVGGVIGKNDSSIVENCYNTGDVSGTGEGVNGTGNRVGGVVGRNAGTVKNCYNTGAVNSTDRFVGGVIGYFDYGTVENCYNIGTVSGEWDYVGGVLAYNYHGTVVNCYYLSGCAKDGNNKTQCGIGYNEYSQETKDKSGCTTGLTDAEMKKKESFVGFDFEKTWTIGKAKDFDYPTLRMAAPCAPGDINGDGKVNAMDCLLLKGYILKTFKNATAEQIERMNVSGDKTINAVDYALLRAAVLGTKVL